MISDTKPSSLPFAHYWNTPHPTKNTKQPATPKLVALLRASLGYIKVYVKLIDEKIVAPVAKTRSEFLMCPAASEWGSTMPHS